MKKRLTGNIISLFTLKGTEYIVSFITLPYLLRVLGPEYYGMIVFAQTLMNYGNLVVDYGFNLTAPRDVAQSDKKELPKQFSAILASKLSLLAGVIMVGALAVYAASDLLNVQLLLCTLPALIGNAIFPIWYFQGIQQMRFITIFNIIARTISVAGIFLLVREEGDYCRAALLLSIVPLLAGTISLGMLCKNSGQLFVMPTCAMIKSKLQEGWDIFLSTVFISFYTNSNIFLLRIMTNDTCVGYFAAASRLIEAVKGILMPISNAIFPHIAVLVKESPEAAVAFICKTVRVIGAIGFALSLAVLIFAEPLVGLVMGASYGESIRMLQIISFLPFIIGLSNVFGIQTMVTFGMQKLFSRILMVSALLNFMLVIPLVHFWEGIGMSVAVVCVESFVTVSMYIMLRRKGIVIR